MNENKTMDDLLMHIAMQGRNHETIETLQLRTAQLEKEEEKSKIRISALERSEATLLGLFTDEREKVKRLLLLYCITVASCALQLRTAPLEKEELKSKIRISALERSEATLLGLFTDEREKVKRLRLLYCITVASCAVLLIIFHYLAS